MNYTIPNRISALTHMIRSASKIVVDAPSGFGKTSVLSHFTALIPKSKHLDFAIPLLESGRIAEELYEQVLSGIRIADPDTMVVIDDFHHFIPWIPKSQLKQLFDFSIKGTLVITAMRMDRDDLSVLETNEFLRITGTDLSFTLEDIQSYSRAAASPACYENAAEILAATGGWPAAVRQLARTNAFSPSSYEDIMNRLLEFVFWTALSDKEKQILLSLAEFDRLTVSRICAAVECDSITAEINALLDHPFVIRQEDRNSYAFIPALSHFLIRKREAEGTAFEEAVIRRTANILASEGKTEEALHAYLKIRDYDGMLSCDLSELKITTENEAKLMTLLKDIAFRCPSNIVITRPMNSLRLAWMLLAYGNNEEFRTILNIVASHTLMPSSPEATRVEAETLLLRSFTFHPDLDAMIKLLREAHALFAGEKSRIIRNDYPWRFGDYSMISSFHTKKGSADDEAEKLEEYIRLLSAMTGGYGCGADALFRTELAYHRGDLVETEILANKAIFLAESSKQSIILIAAAMMLAEVMLHNGDTEGWKRTILIMDKAVQYPARFPLIVGRVFETVQCVLFCELQRPMDSAEWLVKGLFTDELTHAPIFGNAVYAHLNCLLHLGEYVKLIGILQGIRSQGFSGYPFAMFLFYLLESVAQMKLGNRVKATALIEAAAGEALPDGIIFPLVSFSWLLKGLPDAFIQKKEPSFTGRFNEIKERFASGWIVVSKDFAPNSLPGNLTPREKEIAKMAAAGLRNAEIADALGVTENTIRFHLRSIFQKLAIDRRAKLADALKF
ncbi:LuxR C-terminal-related transcriptional regulator [Treponema zuelzerae]|uniref:LuxR C-terminal-related transcriptional regulator n=1 Tax=Teretinema zuelzerae TaxID=156 RepID=A0AAE3EKG6_9SPIR|nr:LuxR C-terminal-related transcriptional regulator [Teretinema zuelzerae]MCD1655906.1 LuxR C-terminal-related transcriptional regulator [Teretinema zuelzerae]